jgi:chromosome segregation ATPase
MADIMAQVEEEILELRSELQQLDAQIEEKTQETRKLKKEKIRMRTGLGGDAAGGDLKDLMRQLRALQVQVAQEADASSLLDDDISKIKMDVMQHQSTLQTLADENNDYDSQIATEERKQRQLQDKHRKIQRESDAVTQQVEELERRLEEAEQLIVQQRQRAGSMTKASEMADQLAELDRLTELQYGLEEEMGDSEELLSEKLRDLEKKQKERQLMEKKVRGLEAERDQLKYTAGNLKSDITSKERNSASKREKLETLRTDIEYIKVKIEESRSDIEGKTNRMRQMAEDTQHGDNQAQQALQTLQQLHNTKEQRLAAHQQLVNQQMQGKDALQRADRMVAVLKEKVKHAEEIADWRMRKVERQLDVQRALREREVEMTEMMAERLRQEKQREIGEVRKKISQQEEQIDVDSNLGKHRPAWSPPKSWGQAGEDSSGAQDDGSAEEPESAVGAPEAAGEQAESTGTASSDTAKRLEERRQR